MSELTGWRQPGRFPAAWIWIRPDGDFEVHTQASDGPAGMIEKVPGAFGLEDAKTLAEQETRRDAGWLEPLAWVDPVERSSDLGYSYAPGEEELEVAEGPWLEASNDHWWMNGWPEPGDEVLD